jgi:hypothetical protein
MVYTPLGNYKYDRGLHRIQSGPNHEGYIVSSSGIQDTGADLGVITAGPPNSGSWYLTTAWRRVPQAVSGYWVDYENSDYLPSGSLSSYTGYRSLFATTIAGAKVITAEGADYGLRDTGKYTYFRGLAPDAQAYSPYNTPEDNTAAQGTTGGGVTHRNYEGGLLTNLLGAQGSANRAEWVYNAPVYCETFTETVRSQSPGLMSSALRYIYRGKSSRYVYNYGSVYHQGPESVRNLLRPFSPTVNSSNQKNI